jgi:hypothetical protein
MTKDTVLINRLWSESNEFKKFWRSYFFMITHPKQCLRLLNFAIKVVAIYKTKTEPSGASNESKNNG